MLATKIMVLTSIIALDATCKSRCPMPYYALTSQSGSYGGIHEARKKNRRGKIMRRRR